jgi:hypothetical protein
MSGLRIIPMKLLPGHYCDAVVGQPTSEMRRIPHLWQHNPLYADSRRWASAGHAVKQMYDDIASLGHSQETVVVNAADEIPKPIDEAKFEE